MGSVWVIKTIKKQFPHFKYKNLFNYQTLKFFIGSHFPNFSSRSVAVAGAIAVYFTNTNISAC
jgi:hypothetical protein